MALDPRLVKAARVLLGWSQEQLAEKAKCARSSLSRFESGSPDTKISTVESVESALKKAGVLFFEETEERGIGLRLKNPEPPSLREQRRSGAVPGEGTGKAKR